MGSFPKGEDRCQGQNAVFSSHIPATTWEKDSLPVLSKAVIQGGSADLCHPFLSHPKSWATLSESPRVALTSWLGC